MKSLTVNNLEVGYRQMGDKHSVSWDDGKARYHYWTARSDLEADEDVIHKNPMLGVGHREPGYFKTRRLRVSAITNFLWTECIAEQARNTGLLAKARQEAEAKQRAEEEKRREIAMRRIKERHGPALFATLGDLVDDSGRRNWIEAINLLKRIRDELNEVR